MTTENEQMDWVRELDPENPQQHQAIGALRDILVRGLRAAFLPRGMNEAFCEDVAQESLLKVLKHIDSFEGRSRFTTWATSIAIRTGISQLRRKHFKDVSFDAMTAAGDLQFDVPDVSGGDPQKMAEKQSVLDTLRRLIDRELTEKQRVVIRALLGGMPVEEIASRTDSNRNAVYKLFHDGRQRLKQGFESAGYEPADIMTVFADRH